MLDPTTFQTLETTCCIAGGGPAGMMLGFLLARQGVDVIVLEKHADFLRDFRGDTIHPSTLEVMKELGLLDELLLRKHEKIHTLSGVIGNTEIPIADFSHLSAACPYIVLMPQWDLLNFMAEQGKKYPTFHLRMQANAIDLIEEQGCVTGVIAETPEGKLKIKATLTIGADGRHSTLRNKAKFTVDDMGVPIDVLWMRMSRLDSDPDQPLGRINNGKIFVMIYRGDYWQCAYVIAKGGYERIQAQGLDHFQDAIRDIAPFLGDRVNELRSWSDIKLLTVSIDRLRSWFKPGLLCIGDAAHAMSPVGGVGINLAVQDAVATANILGSALKRGRLSESDLSKVQERRRWPTHMTQRLQIFIHNHVFCSIMDDPRPMSVPWMLKLMKYLPLLRRIPAYIVGIGFRAEHIETDQNR